MKRFLILLSFFLIVFAVDAQTSRKGARTRKTQTTTRRATSSSTTKSKQGSSAGAKSAFPFCPDNKHPHFIDLDLPSGVKWSCCNVGANNPADYGNAYALGETREKKIFRKENYEFCDNPTSDRFPYRRKGLYEISGTEYDVAHVKMGKSWQMPTHQQLKELIEFCTYEWDTINGVNGGKFTGPNGNSIFLPAGGLGTHDGSFMSRGEWGFYWSGSNFVGSGGQDISINYDNLFFANDGRYRLDRTNRCFGLLIRPIYKY